MAAWLGRLSWADALIALCVLCALVCFGCAYLANQLGRWPRRNRRVALPKPSDLCRRDWSEREMEALRPRR